MSTSPLPPTWTNVPQKIRDRLGTSAGRQRIMLEDGHLLIVLHAPPDPDEPEKREGRLFWRTPSGEWRATGGGSGIGPLRRHVEAYVEAVDKLERRVDEAKVAEDYFQALHAGTPLTRSVKNLHQTLQAAREAVSGDKDLIPLRDLAYDLERATDLLHTQARHGLDYTIARRAEEQARQGEHMLASAHRLNLLAAMFLPITALGSVLGMNLSHGLERLPAPITFWVTALAALCLGAWIRASMPRPQRGTDAPSHS